jgi:hypothetical protein
MIRMREAVQYIQVQTAVTTAQAITVKREQTCVHGMEISQ